MDRDFNPLPPTLLSVVDAVQTRRSIRAFTGKPVPRSTVEFILEVASRAPGGSNIQPWRVYAVAGTPLETLSAELRAAHKDPSMGEANEEYRYCPAEWFEPYLSRRRKLGWSLYGLLGIRNGDKTAMSRQNARNYDFFGAPVGIFFTLDRKLEVGSWLDLGMFMENIMVVARGLGLDICPQVAFTKYHHVVRRGLTIPDTEILVSGMALSYADLQAPENNLRTARPSPRFHQFSWFLKACLLTPIGVRGIIT